MFALIRLAQAQGLLQGDLNEAQQLAVLALMRKDGSDEAEAEYQRFRSMIIAFHLGEAKKILDVLDQAPEEGEYAREITDDEITDWNLVSAEDAQATIDALRRFGMVAE